MLFGYIGYYICRANLPAAFPLLSQTFGYSNQELGLIASISEMVYAVGKFINGPLGDKIGGKKIFLLGMAGAIAMNLLFSQFQTLIAFIIIWSIARYFLSMGWGGVVKAVGHWYEPERNGTMMGIMSINFQFGGVLGTLFAGYLVSLGVGWQGLFIYPALVLSGIFLLSVLGAKESPQVVVPGTHFGQSQNARKSMVDHQTTNNSEEKIFKLIGILWKIPLFKSLLSFAFLTTFLRSIFMFWIPKFLFDIGMKNESAIINSALFPFMGCLGTIFIGWYSDRYAKNGDRARMMWMMLALLTISLIGISFLCTQSQKDFFWIVTLLGLSGFFLLGPYSMSAGALTLDIAGPRAAASCAGIIDGIGYIGGALATWGAGKISDTMGWTQVFILLSFFALLSTLSAIQMSRRNSKTQT